MADLRFTSETLARIEALEASIQAQVTPEHLAALVDKVNTGLADLRFTSETLARIEALEASIQAQVTPEHLAALEDKVNTGLANAEAKVNTLVAAINAAPAPVTHE